MPLNQNVEKFINQTRPLLIGDRWLETDEVIDVINPSDGEKIAEVYSAGHKEVDAAVLPLRVRPSSRLFGSGCRQLNEPHCSIAWRIFWSRMAKSYWKWKFLMKACPFPLQNISSSADVQKQSDIMPAGPLKYPDQPSTCHYRMNVGRMPLARPIMLSVSRSPSVLWPPSRLGTCH